MTSAAKTPAPVHTLAGIKQFERCKAMSPAVDTCTPVRARSCRGHKPQARGCRAVLWSAPLLDVLHVAHLRQAVQLQSPRGGTAQPHQCLNNPWCPGCVSARLPERVCAAWAACAQELVRQPQRLLQAARNCSASLAAPATVDAAAASCSSSHLQLTWLRLQAKSA
jgi:hypothetical protein